MFVSQNCRLFLLMQWFLKSLVNLVETLIKKKERMKEYIKKLEGHHTQERVSRVFIHI